MVIYVYQSALSGVGAFVDREFFYLNTTFKLKPEVWYTLCEMSCIIQSVPNVNARQYYKE